MEFQLGGSYLGRERIRMDFVKLYATIYGSPISGRPGVSNWGPPQKIEHSVSQDASTLWSEETIFF